MTPILVAVLAFVGAVVLTELVGTEMAGWLPVLARAIVRLSARRLPPELTERYVEEWLHDVETLASDRKLSALAWALGTFFTARGIRRDLQDDASKTKIDGRLTYKRLYLFGISQGAMSIVSGVAAGVIAVTGGALPAIITWPVSDSNMFAYFASIGWLIAGVTEVVVIRRTHRRFEIPGDAWLKVEYHFLPLRFRARLVPPARLMQATSVDRVRHGES